MLIKNMSDIKIIKNEQDYNDALKLVEALVSLDPDPESAEGEKLNLLGALIQDYENKAFPEMLPSPIEAIKYRMEQINIEPADLIPFIGSRSRVSDVLSGKRQLTLDMVRALSEGLGISAKVLVQKPKADENMEYEELDDRLFAEMKKRGYFNAALLKSKSKAELLKDFFLPFHATKQLVGMTRKSHFRSSPLTDKHALSAWATRVYKKADEKKVKKKYKHGIVDLSFMQELAKKSREENGPNLAVEFLENNGIILIIEYHFPKTYLDGATILINKNNPIIGLTLRYDRLDNFWFTLMHELAHIALHFNQDINLFYDEIEGIKGVDLNSMESEADKLASEALVPSSKWENSPAKLIPSPMAAQSLADEIGIHIAIVAGVMRHEHKNFYYLNKIVNDFKVRQYFQ